MLKLTYLDFWVFEKRHKIENIMVYLLPQLPLLGALYCLGLAIFVVSRNLRNNVNLSFALGVAGLALIQRKLIR